MRNTRTKQFRKLYSKLSPSIQGVCESAFEQYKRNPRLVQFEHKGRDQQGVPVYGARINENWRALALVDKSAGEIKWFWVGTHKDYEALINLLR